MVAVPEGKTDGWDIGDAVDEGWTAEQIDQHLRTGSRQVYPTQSVEERLIQASLENQNSKEAQGLAIKVAELLLVAENTPIILMGAERSEESRVGKECCSTCRSQWSPEP